LASILIYYGITSNSKLGKKYWISFGAVIILISLVFVIWFFSQGHSKQFFFNQWVFELFKSLPKISDFPLGLHGIGALLSAVIPIILGALLYTGNKTHRVWLAVLALLLIFLLFLSVSGGGWIALAIGTIFILLCWRKRSIYFIIPVSSLVMGIALFYYTHQDWLYQSFSIETLLGRINLWVKTIPLLKDVHSFWGIGLGNWSEKFNSFYHTAEIELHNNFFQIYTDMGIVGVLAISIAIVIFAVTAYKIVNSSESGTLKGIGIGLIGSFLGGAFFNTLDVTLTGTIVEKGSVIYLSIPFLWIWAGFLSVVYFKLFPHEK
jgi:O-antigen ligase